MKFEVKPAPTFVRETKQLLKKYPNMKSEIKAYIESLEKGITGDNIPGFNELWKDRLAMKPYGRGKSGGLRVISYHTPSVNVIVPALIYAKSDTENPPHELLVRTVAEIRTWLTPETPDKPT